MKTNVFLIIFLINLSSGPKRKHTDDETNAQNHDVAYNLHSLRMDAFNFDTSETYRLSTSFDLNQNYDKVGKYDDPFAELFKGFNSVSCSDLHIKDLENNLPNTLKSKKSNVLLANLDNGLSEKVYLSFVDKCEDTLNESEKRVDVDETMHLVELKDDVFEILNELEHCNSKGFNTHSFVDEKQIVTQRKISDEKNSVCADRSNLVFLINKYIAENIPSRLNNHYTNRIQNIDNACATLEKNNILENTFDYIFNPLYDIELLLKLKNISLNFDKNMHFNQLTCNDFSNEFDLKMFNDFYAVELRQNYQVCRMI